MNKFVFITKLHFSKRIIICLGILLVGWLMAVASYIVWIGNKQSLVAADAIVVLGASAYHNRPSPVFEQRIKHGINLYHAGFAKKLIFTGGFGEKNQIKAQFAESEVARAFALKHKVKKQDILFEKISRSTLENLQQAHQIMAAHNLQAVIIVSDPLHIARALRIAKKLDIQAIGSATPTTLFRIWQPIWWQFLAQEVYLFHRDLFLGMAF